MMIPQPHDQIGLPEPRARTVLAVSARQPSMAFGRSSLTLGVRGLLFGAALLASAPLLTGCAEKPKPVEYRLLSVLPTPVTPGDTVTAFGVLPAKANLKFNREPIPGVPVPNGLSFQIPLTVSAGEYALEISGDGVSLPGSVAVNPRIDSLALNGSTLTLVAVGLTSDVSKTSVQVNGYQLQPSLANGVLTASLPSGIAYGGLSVNLLVNGRASQPKQLSFEAATLQGVVRQPGAINGQSFGSRSIASGAASSLASGLPLGRQLVLSDQTRPSDAFLISHTGKSLPESPALKLALESNLERETISTLGITRVRFKDAKVALESFTKVKALIDSGQASSLTSLEWDARFKPSDANEVIPAGVPTTPPTTPGGGQWFLPLEGIPDAWKVSRGAGITVAVIDTGVALEHPDLKANILPGYDFVDDDPIAGDIAGHGTHVAGLVAANGLVTGVAPLAKILPVRVLRDLSGGSAFAVAQGILWSANLLEGKPNPNPAQVLNLSLGSDSYSKVIDQAIEQVRAKGIVVVAAAGNSGGSVAYPAALEGVIAVTAVAGTVSDNAGGGLNGNYSLTYQPSYASRGPRTWVTAFGGDTSQDQDKNGVPDGILSSDTTTSGYGLRMGTSMASPQVAGLAALALASNTPSFLVRPSLAATAIDLGPRGYDFNFGHGLISGQVITGGTSKTYVVAVDSNNSNSLGGRVIGFAVVKDNGIFTLNNLPPDKGLAIVAATDNDADGILGEAGELISSPSLSVFEPRSNSITEIQLVLSDGRQSLSIRML